MADESWNDRDLLFITNNQAGTVMMNITNSNLDVYAAHKPFAESFVDGRNYGTHGDATMRGWFIGRLT